MRQQYRFTGLRPLGLAALSCLALAVSACGSQKQTDNKGSSDDSSTLAQSQLQAIYAEQDIAFARKDSAALYARCAPDFVFTDEDGRASSLAQDKASFDFICANLRSISTSGQVRSVKLLPGGKAQAFVDVHIKTALVNPQGTIDRHEAVQDTWVQGPSGWQLAASRILASRSQETGLTLHVPPAAGSKK